MGIVPTRPEGAEAPSPGQHPGLYVVTNEAPCKGKSFKIAIWIHEAFALTGAYRCSLACKLSLFHMFIISIMVPFPIPAENRELLSLFRENE